VRNAAHRFVDDRALAEGRLGNRDRTVGVPGSDDDLLRGESVVGRERTEQRVLVLVVAAPGLYPP